MNDNLSSNFYSVGSYLLSFVFLCKMDRDIRHIDRLGLLSINMGSGEIVDLDLKPCVIVRNQMGDSFYCNSQKVIFIMEVLSLN